MTLPVIFKHGEIKHAEIIEYPDKQRNLKLDMNYFNNPKKLVEIKCCIREFKDLEILWMLCAALHKHDFHISSINYKYLFGMRSDRAFEHGMPNYFRDVVAPIINELTFKYNIQNIIILNSHSELSLNALDNITFDQTSIAFDKIIIGGDQSAGYPHAFHKIRRENDIIVRLDERNCEYINKKDSHVPILICDDLCDGGATFIKEAEYLKKHFINPIELFVVHGLFTKGFDELFKSFDKIYTTNSYQEFAWHEKLFVKDVWEN